MAWLTACVSASSRAPNMVSLMMAMVRAVSSSATSSGWPGSGALLPLRQHVQRAAGHHLAEAGDATAVKGRLHQPPLAQPQLALAGEQAVAGQLADDVEQVALDVVVVVVLEDALRAVGVVDLVEGDVAQPVAGHVAVLARARIKKPSESR